jgi:hypothetical protein
LRLRLVVLLLCGRVRHELALLTWCQWGKNVGWRRRVRHVLPWLAGRRRRALAARLGHHIGVRLQHHERRLHPLVVVVRRGLRRGRRRRLRRQQRLLEVLALRLRNVGSSTEAKIFTASQEVACV